MKTDLLKRAEGWVLTSFHLTVLSTSHLKALRHFTKHLTEGQIKEALDATNKSTATGPDWQWKYFCSCCWKMIKGTWNAGPIVLNVEDAIALEALIARQFPSSPFESTMDLPNNEPFYRRIQQKLQSSLVRVAALKEESDG